MNQNVPYQRAEQELLRRGEQPSRYLQQGLQTAAGLATAAGTGSIISRALPLLSPYVNSETAIKGIKKLNSRLGLFVENALKKGFGKEEVKEYLEEKDSEEPPKENRNIIEQYSPELFAFMNAEIQNGRTPLQAGALAQASGKFNKEINKIKKDHKTSWGAIIDTVFGPSEEPNKRTETLSKFNERLRGQGMQEREQERFQQYYGQQQGQGQGSADDRLMAMLQQVSQVLGK